MQKMKNLAIRYSRRMLDLAKRLIVLHPFLFAMWPILAYYSSNKAQLTPTDLLVPSAIVLSAVFVVTALLWLIFKDVSKSAIVASVIAPLFLTANQILDSLLRAGQWRYSSTMTSWTLLLWSCLTLVFGLFLFSLFTVLAKTRRDLTKLTVLLSVVGVVLVIMPIATIVRYEAFDQSRASSPADTDWGELGSLPEELPDIYYIVLDAYASSATLKEFYEYDNSQFTEYLKSKGFYVASQSRSNYNMTWMSLASSLNMQYVNHLVDTSGLDYPLAREMVKNNRVVRYLKAAGYSFVHFSSGVGATDSNGNADFAYTSSQGLNEFSVTLLRKTMAHRLLAGVIEGTQRDKILFTFSKMANLWGIEGPKFVFAHINCPHPPFVFGPNGERVPEADLAFAGNVWERKALYLDQLVYTNVLTMTLIDTLLSQSRVSPIIILQSDHGPASYDVSGQPTDDYLRQRFGNLNAYFLPGAGNSVLYENITPVNTFRVIFDFYFGTHFGLLEQRSYYESYNPPYEFFDATDRLGDTST